MNDQSQLNYFPFCGMCQAEIPAGEPPKTIRLTTATTDGQSSIRAALCRRCSLNMPGLQAITFQVDLTAAEVRHELSRFFPQGVPGMQAPQTPMRASQ